MMKARALPTPTSMIFVVGFLVLGGIFSVVPPAYAQTQEACPLPDGVAPPPDPPVTAQQVEDGSASLMDFALTARDRYKTPTSALEEALYFQCSVRQEGSPWRFRFHLPRATDARRQGVRTREVHGIVGQTTQPLDLCRDPFCAGSRTSRSGESGFSRSCHRGPGFRRCHGHLVARTGCRIRCDQPNTRCFRAMPPYLCWAIRGSQFCCSPDSISVSPTWFPLAMKQSITATRPLLLRTW